MINPNYDSIVYSSYTKLADIANDIADTRKQSKIDKLSQQGAIIRYYLRALRFSGYITDDQVNQILECLIEVAGIQNYPVAPNLPTLVVPSTGTTIIVQGEQGPRGEDGGGTDFSENNVVIDTVVDSFGVGEAYAARWDYLVNGTAQRAGTVLATWTEDGAAVDWNDSSTPDVNGSTNDVEFSVVIIGATVNLMANVTGGTWNIVGSRYLIPNNGAGVSLPTSLSDGKIFIGSAANVPVEQTVTGDISLTNAGVAAIGSGVIVNADVNTSAAIAVSKLAALTASRAVVSDASGFLTTSASTSTEVGYLSGVTSNIQTQLDSKVSAASGAISTVVSLDLTASRAVISNPSGKIAVSSVTTTELGYVSGVTSAIQTQINSKVTSVSSTLLISVVAIGDWNMDSTAFVNVAHGLSDFKKVRAVEVIIRNDGDTDYRNIYQSNFTTGANTGGSINAIDATNISLSRIDSGNFDGTTYDSTSYNRGWITITYEA